MHKSYILFFIVMHLWSYAGKEEEEKEIHPTGKQLFEQYDTLIRVNKNTADTALYNIADRLLSVRFIEDTAHMRRPQIKSRFVNSFIRQFGFYAWFKDKDRKNLTLIADTLFETVLLDRGMPEMGEKELSISDFDMIVELTND